MPTLSSVEGRLRKLEQESGVHDGERFDAVVVDTEMYAPLMVLDGPEQRPVPPDLDLAALPRGCKVYMGAIMLDV